MKMPIADLSLIIERLEALSEELINVWDSQSAAQDHALSPEELCGAMRKLGTLLHQMDETLETRGRFESQELKALGDHGLHLISELADCASGYQMTNRSQEIRRQCFPFAVWLARHGGELTNLEPVVNALADLANGLTRSEDLARLYQEVGEIVEAASPRLSEGRPADPWRLLVLNRAIVATRSHRPPLIRDAYDMVIETLPEDAESFLAEAMEQMDLLDYPTAVREVVNDYFQRCGKSRVLH